MTENNILGRLVAEIRRLEEQRDATAMRIEQATQRIEKLGPHPRWGSVSESSPGSEMADAEHEHAKEAYVRERPTEGLHQSVASKPNEIVEKAKAHRHKEERPTLQRKRYGYY